MTDSPEDPPDSDRSGSLRDTEEAAGDEGELGDLFTLDRTEAREAGVDLDDSEDEPVID
ncbi:MAG TPA: hypothetical protein VNG13_03310 [Mycobacteriales bacterium]|nr:hypothetical protein [Mycobacteriales bacterium]